MNVHSESYLLRLLTCIFICSTARPRWKQVIGNSQHMRLNAHRESQNISIVPPPNDPAHSSRYAASHACMQSCSVTTALQNSLNAVRWDNPNSTKFPINIAHFLHRPDSPEQFRRSPFRPEEIGSLISNPFLYCNFF
jgi:hypothetical protein